MFNSINDRFNIPPTIAVTSGKGGVGKTLIALGISTICAERDIRVLLIDGDMGLGNLHILTNTTPVFTIEDYLKGECKIEDAIIPVGKNLDLLPASSGVREDNKKHLVDENKVRVSLAGLKQHYDLLVFDTPSGINTQTINLITFADQVFLVVTSDLASLADGYAVLKLILGKNINKDFSLIVNMSQTSYEGEMTVEKFNRMSTQFLGLKMKHSFWLPHDTSIKNILKRQNILEQNNENCVFLRYLKTAADKIAFNDKSVQEMSSVEKEGKINTDHTLSSQTPLSDRRNVKSRAGQFSNIATTKTSSVSRDDTI